MERGSAAAAALAAAGAPSAKRKRISSPAADDEGAQDLHRMLKEAAELDHNSSSSSSSTTTSSSETSSSTSSSSFEAVVQDEVKYRACRHAPLPHDVARTLQTKAEWGRGAAVAHQQRSGEEAVQRKQAELDRTNHLYKALARKSFQLSVTLLNQADLVQAAGNALEPSTHPGGARPPIPSSATTPATAASSHPSLSSASASDGTPPTIDIHRTIVLPAAMPLAKLHKTLQTMVGWQDTQKYTFLTADGVPIAKYSKDDVPCLSDSKIRLAYIVKDPGDEFYYQYSEWIHRLVVETIGAPRRNIPSTRVISGAGQCPPDGSTPATYAESTRDGETQPFSVDAINAQLMAGQTFYMRIPAGASKDHEELVCLRAMRTPVNILTVAPSNLDAATSSTSSSEAASSVLPPNRASAYSAPTSAGLSSIAPSPPVTASSHHHAAAPASVERYQEYYQGHGHHHRQPQQQHQTRIGESSWDPAAFMSMPSSGSLPGHYYPSSLQHAHDVTAWRDEAEQQHRHLSAPSFFSMSSSSSSAAPSSNGQSHSPAGAFSPSLPPSSSGGWPSSPFSVTQRSLATGVPSLPSSSFSSSYPPSESEDGDDVYYARDRYPQPSAYPQHNHQQQHQHSRQQPYQHQQTLFPHYETSRASFSAGPSPSMPLDLGGTAASSLAPRSPSAHLLPFPSHTLPPFPSYLVSSPASAAAAAGASPGAAMRSRSPSPLFPPPSSFGGLYPLPPSSSSSSSLPHDLMLCPSPSSERLPPLSGTAALFSPDSPLPLFSSSSSSSTSVSSSPASAVSLPPFPMSISPPPAAASCSSSFSTARTGLDGASGHSVHYQSQPQHHHHHQQHHTTTGYPPSRSGGAGTGGGSFVAPSPTFPPSFLLSRGSETADPSPPDSAHAGGGTNVAGVDASALQSPPT